MQPPSQCDQIEKVDETQQPADVVQPRVTAAGDGTVVDGGSGEMDDFLAFDDGGEGAGEPLDNMTPIPRVDAHLRSIQNPRHFRTLYINKLGIWARNEARQLTSSTRKEVARYKTSGYVCGYFRRTLCFGLLFCLQRTSASCCLVFQRPKQKYDRRQLSILYHTINNNNA